VERAAVSACEKLLLEGAGLVEGGGRILQDVSAIHDARVTLNK